LSYSLRAIRYRGPMLPDLVETGRRLYFRACDLSARMWLNEVALDQYNGSGILVHAERYLADRLAYELAPWPKGKIKIETEDDYALP